ncbi:MAG: acyl-[acyl-carrier-protein] thioesterase [Desulfobacterales bacterium]
MKVTTTRRIGFFEVNGNFALRLRVLLNCLQEAATVHSQQAGYETLRLIKEQKAWVLHRIAIQVHSPPVCGDEIEVVTWHKGSRGFRSYRDFEIYRNGEKLVSAASLWLFIDLARKKILRPPQDVGACYGVETRDALDADINKWKTPRDFDPEAAVAIATRPSDYDPLGHVNNALYFDYLETLAERVFEKPQEMRTVIVQFNKEIAADVSEVSAGLKKQDPGYIFNVSSPAGTHAAGEFFCGQGSVDG